MATYKFGKYITWEGYEYFAISEKTFFGWKERKTFGLSILGTHSKEDEKRQKQAMMESVDRLIKAGHTVL
jgi:hypothetical protein